MSDTPHTPAAFINAIAEEGSKKEAVEWLQKTWNERCQLERENEALRKLLAEAEEAAEPLIKYARMRAAKPMRGTDDTIHSIHVGTEWEAELNQSDLLRLAEVVAALNKEKSCS